MIVLRRTLFLYLTFAARDRRNGFQINIEVNKEHLGAGKVKGFHKMSQRIMMIGTKTSDELFELAINHRE